MKCFIKHNEIFFIPELTHAATKIQACFRGHVERKKVHKDDDKKDDDIDIDEITKKVRLVIINFYLLSI